MIVSLIFGLNALEITDINIFFDGWWTLFIIIPCFIDFFKDKVKLILKEKNSNILVNQKNIVAMNEDEILLILKLVNVNYKKLNS